MLFEIQLISILKFIIFSSESCLDISRELDLNSLVIRWSCVEHVGLKFGEESLFVFALTDLLVEQMWVDGRVVDLHQPLFNRLSCKEDRMFTQSAIF